MNRYASRAWTGTEFLFSDNGIPKDWIMYDKSQCTGVIDENWKPIYENDIVLKSCQEYIIKWKHGSYFLACPISGLTYLPLSSCFRDVRIVGNKYENPEKTGAAVIAMNKEIK